jgi:hypothetical protein
MRKSKTLAINNTQAKNKFTSDDIKRWYLNDNGMEQFEMFRAELVNLARQIHIWLAISNAKSKFKRLKHEDFWGWTQQIATLRLIAIDSLKICKDSMPYLKSVIENNIGTKNYMNLIKRSRLSNRVKLMRKIIEPIKLARNKRFAHFENEEVEEFNCCLQDLLISLINLDDSLGFISHYLLNPHYIINEKWNMFNLEDTTKITQSSYLMEYLMNDRVVTGCSAILSELNEKVTHSALVL